MVETTVVRTIRVRGTSEGIDKLTADLAKLAGAQEDVAVVSENAAKRIISTQEAYRRQTMAVDDNARAQARIAKETNIATAMLKQGDIDAQQHAERIALITQRYGGLATASSRAAAATTDLTKQTSRNAAEMLNLGRQFADVAVSVQAGQSLMTVGLQQGAQIVDVFASSGRTVGQIFSQAAGWAGRFAASTAGIVTGVMAIGGAALYMGASFASAQKEIDRALSGAGVGSGVSRGGINRIAETAASATGLSISEARQAATAFAATGTIYTDNVRSATLMTKEFARAMGIDAAEATKKLAKDLQDPVAAALEWNKTLGFLDRTTLNHIRSLEMMGKHQEAINALIAAAGPAFGKSAQHVDIFTRAYDALANAISDTADKWGAFAARIGQKITGAQLGGFSDEESLRLLGQRIETRSRGVFAQGLDAPVIRALKREYADLEEKIRKAGKATEEVRFDKLMIEADALTRAIIPQIAQIEKFTKELTDLQKAQEALAQRGEAPDPLFAAAANARRLQIVEAENAEAAERRRVQAVSELVVQYGNLGPAVAQQVHALDQQLELTQARTVNEELSTRYNQTIGNAVLQQHTDVEAIAIATRNRAIAEAEIDKYANEQLRHLQQEGELIRASSDAERDRIKARQTYQNLIDKGVGPMKAEAVAMQELANAEAARRKQEEEASERALANIKTEQDAWNAYKQGVISWSEAVDAAVSVQRRAERAMESVNGTVWDTTAALNAQADAWYENAKAMVQFTGLFATVPQGSILRGTIGTNIWEVGPNQLSQFDPAGYKSQTPQTQQALFNATNIYGPGGFTQDTTMASLGLLQTVPNAQGLEALVNKAGTAGTSASIDAMLSGLGSANTELVQSTAQILSRLTNLLPEEEQAGAIRKQLGALGDPTTLAGQELVKQLNDQLERLTKATEDNTSATEAMTDVLSPFYSSDPRRTYLGFRAFAGGGIMTDQGATPLQGGIAHSRQVAVFGEGSTPEAFVPVPTGRIPVEMKQPANSNQRPVNVTINVMGNADAGTVAALKSTAFQQAQAMRRAIG